MIVHVDVLNPVAVHSATPAEPVPCIIGVEDTPETKMKVAGAVDQPRVADAQYVASADFVLNMDV